MWQYSCVDDEGFIYFVNQSIDHVLIWYLSDREKCRDSVSLFRPTSNNNLTQRPYWSWTRKEAFLHASTSLLAMAAAVNLLLKGRPEPYVGSFCFHSVHSDIITYVKRNLSFLWTLVLRCAPYIFLDPGNSCGIAIFSTTVYLLVKFRREKNETFDHFRQLVGRHVRVYTRSTTGWTLMVEMSVDRWRHRWVV